MRIYISVVLEIDVERGSEPDDVPEWAVVSPDGEYRLDGTALERLVPGVGAVVRRAATEAADEARTDLEVRGPTADIAVTVRVRAAGGEAGADRDDDAVASW